MVINPLKKGDSFMGNDINATFCSKHPNCCYFKECPVEFEYDGNKGNEWFIRWDKYCE